MYTLNQNYTVKFELIKTYLSQNNYPFGTVVSLGVILLSAILSQIYWAKDWIDLHKYLAATPNLVFLEGEYWRAWTSALIHADLQHFLSNAYMLGIWGYFSYSHFGYWMYPVAGIFFAGIINLLSLATYHGDVVLVGASGLVYYLGGTWLTLFLLIEKKHSFARRWLKASAVGFFIFFPTKFSPEVSYRTHAIGFGVGIVGAFLIYFFMKDKIKSKEVWVPLEDDDDFFDFDYQSDDSKKDDKYIQ